MYIYVSHFYVEMCENVSKTRIINIQYNTKTNSSYLTVMKYKERDFHLPGQQAVSVMTITNKLKAKAARAQEM